MAFQSLSTDIQNILYNQFYTFSKVFWIFVIVSFSLVYLFYWKKFKEKKTPFFSVGIMRIIMTALCTVNLLASPIMYLILTPETDIGNIVPFYTTLYFIAIGIFLAVITVDAFFFSPQLMFRLGGLDIGSSKVRQAFSKIFKRRLF